MEQIRVLPTTYKKRIQYHSDTELEKEFARLQSENKKQKGKRNDSASSQIETNVSKMQTKIEKKNPLPVPIKMCKINDFSSFKKR